ncbi:MAG TPA: ATP-binding protein [Polyangiaceae bacterium]|nr:ATP-binding protein [Polyangiaceae bacterium]
MLRSTAGADHELPLRAFEGGGEAGKLVRSIDWSRSTLGRIEAWPKALVATVSMLLHSRHPMFLWWGPNLVQFYNDAYLPSFGRGKHPKAFGQAGRDCWPEIWSVVEAQIDAVMQRGEPSWNQDHLVPIERNGQIEEVYWTYGYSPVFDDAGEIGGTLVVCTETTHRVLSDRRLRAIAALTERLSTAIDFTQAARETARTLERCPKDVPFVLIYQQKRTDDVALVASSGVKEERLPEIDRAVRGHLSAERSRITTFVPFALELASPIFDRAWNEPLSQAVVVSVARDEHRAGFVVFGISPKLSFDDAYRTFLEQIAELLALTHARLETQRARAAAENVRNNLLLQAPVPTAIFVGPEHRFELANARYREMVGRPDPMGKTFEEVFPELSPGPLPSILDRVYLTGEPFVTDEYLVKLDRSGGQGPLEDRYFKFNLEPTRDLSGVVYGMMLVAIDVTEQVSARKSLERVNQEREKMVRELESASRTKDEFLAMLGHELRNPLSPIVTALQLMKLRGDSASAREQSIIERQVNHLVRLVDDLLDVSKITRGKVELRRELVEASSVLGKAVEIASFLFEQRGHQLSVDIPKAGLLLWCDPVRIGQVVANLLTNAARYTQPGGHVWVSGERRGDEIVITVRDEGIGISKDFLPQVFDLFVQGKRSTDRAEGGLGIGLSLVKNLVELHGGSVSAASNGPGTGSEFVVRLPSAPASMAIPCDRTITPSEHTAALANRKRVLIVDDNPDAAESLGDLLRAHGHHVAIVNDPLDALKRAKEFLPHIAVLDIGMPVMDGYDLAAQFQNDRHVKSCHLIALTGYGQEHDVARATEAGFHQHFVKPVDVQKLIAAIAAAG